MKEIIESAQGLISRVCRHPAITNFSEDVDLLDQIDSAIKYVAEIDDNITNQLYKNVRTIYSKRFPELKVANPMQYILTAQLLGNQPERVKEEEIKNQLFDVLDSKMHLLVTMTASTTQGTKLEPEEIYNVMQACSVAQDLTDLRTKLLSFVEKNMATIAPNLSVIVGAPVAAKLMGLTGGIVNLSHMPSCNVSILGSHRVSNIESNINAPPRVGLIYECDLIQKIPFDHIKDVRKRAVKWIANKCVLAARCDASQSDPDGKAGRIFRNWIENHINKELEPPPKKAARPLPAPIEKSGKKRGGKRVRRMKERYATTELRKAANRINFGEVGDDAYQNDLGFDRSQLNAIQKLQVDERTRIRPQRDRGKLKLTATQQGLEIYNPEARESYTAGTSGESSNYFSNTAGFLNVKKEE